MDCGSSQKMWHSFGRGALRVIEKATPMNIKQLGERLLIATGAVILMTVAASASSSQQGQSSIAETSAAQDVPHDLPKAATQAMKLAQKWHNDAQMIDLRIRESNNYAIEFDFQSPSDRSTLYVQSINGQFTSQVMPPVTTSATGGPLPLEFLDLPAAIAKAEEQGMPQVIKEASLGISGGKNVMLTWAIQPDTDDALTYTQSMRPAVFCRAAAMPQTLKRRPTIAAKNPRFKRRALQVLRP
jgi:hypothetical protein